MAKVTKDITGTDQFTDSISPITFDYNGQSGLGYLNIHIFKGSWTATIELQKSYDGGSTWETINIYSSATNTSLRDYESGVLYRLGISSDGSYSSGTIPVRLSR